MCDIGRVCFSLIYFERRTQDMNLHAGSLGRKVIQGSSMRDGDRKAEREGNPIRAMLLQWRCPEKLGITSSEDRKSGISH